MRKDVVQAGDVKAEKFLPLLLLGLVEQRDVYLAAIEVQTANGFAVVVVEADTWVGPYLKYSSSCQLARLLRM